MENKNISQIVIERIKDEGIKPISRNVFSIKRVLFWVVVGVSFIIGAFTFSFIISALFHNDWDLFSRFGYNFVFKTLPYFWFISLVVFIIIGEFYYRKTLFGHRKGLVLVVGIYVISTTFFGSVFYFVGVGDIMEKSLLNVSPSYRNVILNRHEIWSHPENGLLSGRITKIGDGEIEVIDFNGFIWIVDINNSYIRGKTEIEVGENIKIIGDKTENSFFSAEEIRPWIGVGMNGNRRELKFNSINTMR